jgi:hypothetical protein
MEMGTAPAPTKTAAEDLSAFNDDKLAGTRKGARVSEQPPWRGNEPQPLQRVDLHQGGADLEEAQADRTELRQDLGWRHKKGGGAETEKGKGYVVQNYIYSQESYFLE